MDELTESDGRAVPSKYWMAYDFAAGLCSEEEIGRLKGPLVEARRLAQQATPKAIRALIESAEQQKDVSARIKAANALLDRAWGRPEAQSRPPIQQDYPQLSWVSARRLLYKEIAKHAEDAVEVPPLPHPPSSDDPTP